MHPVVVHNVLMVGPPGAAKTLLARDMPGILPRMAIEEALDVTRIYSVADLLPSDVPLIRNRPFRAPHHTISHALYSHHKYQLYPRRHPCLSKNLVPR